MSTNYQQGYQFEYKVKNLFQKHKQCIAARSPASKTPTDIYVMCKDQTYLIQCKTTKKDKLYVYGLDKLKEQAQKINAVPLLAYSLHYTAPYITKVKEDSFKTDKDSSNVELREVLEKETEPKFFI
ncbi:MAG: hypothetical protein EF811_02790 [Methanonatronarchaeia archaeon]|nr:MAG: hypothetical protein EF811_02790 [Methanonatronarchaeia archaeon]